MFGHKAKACPKYALTTTQLGSQTIHSTSAPAVRGSSQSANGGTPSAKGRARGKARVILRSMITIWYVMIGRAKIEASNAVITCIILVCHCSASILFDPESAYSYVSTYFAMNIDYVCKPLAVPINVSTPVSESLVVDQVNQSCIVMFLSSETDKFDFIRYN